MIRVIRGPLLTIFGRLHKLALTIDSGESIIHCESEVFFMPVKVTQEK